MIAIKDMKTLPSCCMNCTLLGKEEMYCPMYPRRDLDVITVATSRPDWCPLVDMQEHKVGKWIRVDHTKVKCSNCDITHLIAQYPHGVIDYCPNCGSYNCNRIEDKGVD